MTLEEDKAHGAACSGHLLWASAIFLWLPSEHLAIIWGQTVGGSPALTPPWMRHHCFPSCFRQPQSTFCFGGFASSGHFWNHTHDFRWMTFLNSMQVPGFMLVQVQEYPPVHGGLVPQWVDGAHFTHPLETVEMSVLFCFDFGWVGAHIKGRERLTSNLRLAAGRAVRYRRIRSPFPWVSPWCPCTALCTVWGCWDHSLLVWSLWQLKL